MQNVVCGLGNNTSGKAGIGIVIYGFSPFLRQKGEKWIQFIPL